MKNYVNRLKYGLPVFVAGACALANQARADMSADAVDAVEALAAPIAAVQGAVMTVVVAAVTGWIIVKLVKKGGNKAS